MSQRSSTCKYESFNQRYDGSDWKTFSVLLKPSQRLIKLVGGRSFLLKENSYFPGCSVVRFLLVGCLVEVADKKRATWALVLLFWLNFACELEEEELFSNVCPMIKRLS